MGAAGGDSGSPVFEISPDNPNEVTLYGLLFGALVYGNGEPAGKAYFSPIGEILWELGVLYYHP